MFGSSAERNGVERPARIAQCGHAPRIDSGGTPPRIAQCGHAPEALRTAYSQIPLHRTPDFRANFSSWETSKVVRLILNPSSRDSAWEGFVNPRMG